MTQDTSERIGVIDIGTNTALLLVASWDDGRLVPMHSASGFVRLGEGIDASRRVGAPALGRLRHVLASHVKEASDYGVHSFIVTGTSASRDASNSDDIRSVVREETGADLRILSGEEEARVTFAGALAGLTGQDAGMQDESVVTVVDVGGGSTECVQGPVDGSVMTFKQSLDMGSVRMSERFFTSQPPDAREIEAASDACRKIMDQELTGIERSKLCIGASGTAVLLALLHGEDGRGEQPLTGNVLAYEEVVKWTDHLLSLSADEVLALIPTHAKGREDVFPAGVLMLRLVMEHVGAERLCVSPYGVRHGVAIDEFSGMASR